MIGALLTGLVAGIVGRLLVPDMWSELHGPSSWLFSLLLGLAGALLGYLIFTVGLGIGDSDVFDFGGIVGAVIGVDHPAAISSGSTRASAEGPKGG